MAWWAGCAQGSRCLVEEQWNPVTAWAKPLPQQPRVEAGREHWAYQAGVGKPQALAGSHCPVTIPPVPS